jgi:hypothetical protein
VPTVRSKYVAAPSGVMAEQGKRRLGRPFARKARKGTREFFSRHSPPLGSSMNSFKNARLRHAFGVVSM